jgi:hypothetical protein
MKDDRTLILLHIPKTAGTTLRSVLLQQYDDGAVCCVYDGSPAHMSLAEFAELNTAQKRKYRAIIGHLRYGMHSYLPINQPYTYAAVLRHPTKRVLSLYNHLMNDQFAGRASGVSDFIKKFRIDQFDNYQVRCLSGVYAEFGKCDERMLQTAMQNLVSNFALVGVTEMLDETLFAASKTLGWKPVSYLNKNLGSAMRRQVAAEVGPKDIRLIEKYNTLDLRLYEFAQQLLEEKLRSAGPDWEAQLGRFKERLAAKREKPAPLSVEGNLGLVTQDCVRGWAKIKKSDEFAQVKVVVNDDEEFTVAAAEFRKDLKEQGIHPTGRCGFALRLQEPSRLKPGDKVRAFVVGSPRDLPGSPAEIPIDDDQAAEAEELGSPRTVS